MKLYSIITGKCPVCHQECMYVNSNPYQIFEVLKMHERCKHCKTKYKIEPAFFFGAMYVSYAVGIVFASVAFAVSHYILQWGLFADFCLIVCVLLLLYPIILRISRNIWINIFLHYDATKR